MSPAQCILVVRRSRESFSAIIAAPSSIAAKMADMASARPAGGDWWGRGAARGGGSTGAATGAGRLAPSLCPDDGGDHRGEPGGGAAQSGMDGGKGPCPRGDGAGAVSDVAGVCVAMADWFSPAASTAE